MSLHDSASEQRLSDEQRRAVEHPPTDACVVAGAGSGKTRVLTERFLRLVGEHGMSVRRVPALTFTEKAASEMRKRIRSRLLALGRVEDALEVEFAPIQTLHGYCATLLRLHAVEAGLDPAFRVLDAGEAALLRDEAAELAEQWLFENKASDLVAMRQLDAQTPRIPFLMALERLHGAGHTASDVVWHPGPVDGAAAKSAAKQALAELDSAASQVLTDEKREPVDAALVVAHAALRLRPDPEGAYGFACAEAATAIKSSTRARKQPFGAAKNAAEAALRTLCEARLDDLGTGTLLGSIRTVLMAYERHYERAKHVQWTLDFTDLERRAVALLEQFAASGRSLDFAPQALLVDEYQDTNPLQARLLSLLRTTAPQFAVGDPKQSIYRFRGADVRVLLAERQRVGADGEHLLQDSYRAVPELVDTLNGLHAALFQDNAAGVPYEPLRAAGQFASSDDPTLSVHLIRTEGKIDDARVLEARWIASQIKALVASKTPKRRNHSGAPIGYGDIAILMRARTSLDTYESALNDAGVPYLTLKGTGYYLADELQDLSYVLRVLHNPSDDFALAATLTGPAFAADEDDLSRWFGYPERAWDRLAIEASGTGRLAAQVRMLRDLQDAAVAGSLANLVSAVLYDLGLLDVALLHRNGARRAANLRKAVDVARTLETGGRLGLDDFLRHLARMRDREMPEQFAPVGGDGTDVVRITTVHGAKGLEYPVVFLADAGRQGGADHGPFLRVHEDGSLACKVRDPLEGARHESGGFAALKAAAMAADAAESLRVFYVASTRAEERLVVSAPFLGVTKAGRPKGVKGWMGSLFDVAPFALEIGEHVAIAAHADGVTKFPASIVNGDDFTERPPPPPTKIAPPDGAARHAALLARTHESIAPLGGTRFVVSVSDLVVFAESPRHYYERGISGRSEPDEGALRVDDLADPVAASPDSGAAARARRRARWDEGASDERGPSGGDPAAEGSAFHGFVERLGPATQDTASTVNEALLAEFGRDVPAASGERVHAMASRFLRMPRAQQMLDALRAGLDVRRELALHARVRFPDRARVGPYPALLVNGTIDLWLPTGDGVWILDHKTNRQSQRFPTPESVGAHYALQLRLYALMAERLRGEDVAGASLLLVDASWGPEPLEVPVDVGGETLVEARLLCQALAIAELEGRFPGHWRDLVSSRPSPAKEMD